MNLLPYIGQLHDQLMLAADAGGDEARVVAERLVAPLESAARLMLLDALSNAASEITRDLAPGSVDVWLRGVDPEFVVSAVPEPASYEALIERGVPVAGDGEEGGTSRTTLRLPEHLKVRVEESAGRDGLSVNSWLVRAVSAALDADADGGRRPLRQAHGEQNYTGWVQS